MLKTVVFKSLSPNAAIDLNCFLTLKTNFADFWLFFLTAFCIWTVWPKVCIFLKVTESFSALLWHQLRFVSDVFCDTDLEYLKTFCLIGIKSRKPLIFIIFSSKSHKACIPHWKDIYKGICFRKCALNGHIKRVRGSFSCKPLQWGTLQQDHDVL